MENLFVGGLAILIGIPFVFFGFRAFFFLLPLWGFIAGFMIGTDALRALTGDGFLATALSWIVGFILGLALMLFSYLVWYFAVIVFGGGLGYLLGSGILVALGVEQGFVTVLAGAAVAVVFIILFFVLNMPSVLVAVGTAAGGAAFATAGLLLILNQITREEIGRGIFAALVGHPLAILIAVVLAVSGTAYQLLTMREEQFNLVDKSRYRVS